MTDFQLDDENTGARLFDRGFSIDWCENADQEWGWLVRREEIEGIPAQ